MTQHTEPTVTQEDREAASAAVEYGIGPPFNPDFSSAILTGVWDNHPLVQAFARHRTTAEAAATKQALERATPWTPPECAWGGLPRQIVFWLDMHPKTPRTLFRHLKSGGYEIPQWLRDEPEMQSLDHVPSKGTRAVLIYRAMLHELCSLSETNDVQ